MITASKRTCLFGLFCCFSLYIVVQQLNVNSRGNGVYEESSQIKRVDDDAIRRYKGGIRKTRPKTLTIAKSRKVSSSMTTTPTTTTTPSSHTSSDAPTNFTPPFSEQHTSYDTLLSTTPLSTELTDETMTTVDIPLLPTSQQTMTKKIDYCNPTSIQRRGNFQINRTEISCVPTPASARGCELAEELYHNNEELKTCGNSIVVSICRTEGTNSNFQCSFDDCLKHGRKNVLVWKVDDKSGQLKKKKLFKGEDELLRGLVKLADSSYEEGYRFLLLECTDTFKYQRVATDIIGQLIIIPAKPTKPSSSKHNKNSPNEKINIDLMMIDSASRSHFYRSLPETLSTFNHINNNPQQFAAEILDFESFQAVDGHTNENLHALFTGELFPKNYTPQQKNLVAFGDFFKRFTEYGYSTFYQDDMCYDEMWGLRKNLGRPEKWKDFKFLLKKNHINHTGLTFSSCKILKVNGASTPFHGPSSPWCFNGRFVDVYHLDFSYIYHEFASRHNEQLVSLTLLSVAHDQQGTRIQSIDSELANYVRKMSQSSNTLTILFADHGNTYTHYSGAVVEGRMEQYRPSFFMIVPQRVQEILGKNIMNNLRTNQFKLITLIDVHQALVTVPRLPAAEGIFGVISSTRTCNDVSLRLPNVCLCQGWSLPALNDTAHLSILHFAVGQLNNRIQSSQKLLRSAAAQSIPKCKRLVPTSYFFITERIDGRNLITSFDFKVMAGNGAAAVKQDHFQVHLQSEYMPDHMSNNLTLLSFERVSMYGPYRACADDTVDIMLCICDLVPATDKHHLFKNRMEKYAYKELSETQPNLAETLERNITIKRPLNNNKCLYLKQISYPNINRNGKLAKDRGMFSITYELANICANSYKVSFNLTGMKNLKTSVELPIIRVINPFSTVYLGTVVRVRKIGYAMVKSVKLKVLQKL